MKKTSNKPFLHVGKILLIILAFPFALVCFTVWAAILLGKAAAEAAAKKKPAAKLN